MIPAFAGSLVVVAAVIGSGRVAARSKWAEPDRPELGQAPAATTPAQRSRDQAIGGQLDRLVERYRVGRRVPGIAVAVVRNGSVIKATGYGVANLELGTPVRPRTLFGLGSISKQFTATAIMQLVEDGRVRLDDPMTKYLASLPTPWKPLPARPGPIATAPIGCSA